MEHGGSHEGAASRQLPDDVDGLVGQRAGHRLGQLANLAGRERAQSQMGLRVEPPQSVIGRQFLGPKSEHQQHMRVLDSLVPREWCPTVR